MLYLGKNITSPKEILQEVKVEAVYRATINEKGEVATKINRLQAVRMLDAKAYRKLKIQLPFLVCGKFHPRIRRKENFLSIEYFFLDLDHLQAYDKDIDRLREIMKMDPRLVFMFSSPSGDGLKLLFKLKERITDTGYYSLFYKAFAMNFATQYELNGVVDMATHDVSRCCFVSCDPKAYYNASAEAIDAEVFIPKESDKALFELKKEIKVAEKEVKIEHKEMEIAAPVEEKLNDDILTEIKKMVGVRVKKKVEKNYVQPKELDIIIPEILEDLSSINVSLVEMKPISYGRQIRVAAGEYWAEINVFYGGRGVVVVKTTKSGSNPELAEAVHIFLSNKFQNKKYN